MKPKTIKLGYMRPLNITRHNPQATDNYGSEPIYLKSISSKKRFTIAQPITVILGLIILVTGFILIFR